MDIVIGIGNEMRGDDGIGPRVVDAIRHRSDMETMTVHQLVPELAERIQCARRVLFVDASLAGDDMCLTRIEPSPHRGLGHACSPGALLGWMRLAFTKAPESWLLGIPGSSFELGDGPSPNVVAQIPGALERIEAWLRGSPEPVLMMSEEEA